MKTSCATPVISRNYRPQMARPGNKNRPSSKNALASLKHRKIKVLPYTMEKQGI